MKELILASGSPRRKELMEQVGLKFKVCVSRSNEITSRTKPDEVVKDLSYEKARAVYEDGHRDDIVIGADTIVYMGESILGKPKNEKQCRQMLEELSGRSHYVYTGVTILWTDNGTPHVLSFTEMTKVRLHKLTDSEIDEYIAMGESMDKAGAYGIQGSFAKFIEGIEGDYNNVVGLPVARLYQELKKHGFIEMT